MPQVSAKLVQRALALNPLLPGLLRITGDLPSAQNELRWLREHAQKGEPGEDENGLLEQYVSRRSGGEPLQYILGSAFFGNIEIKCRPGVLIPRQETAASVSYLVSLLRAHHPTTRHLSVLDVCSGSGCIPLLFHHDFYAAPFIGRRTVDFIGVDISQDALHLARENQAIQVSALSKSDRSAASTSLRGMQFMQANALRSATSPELATIPTIRQAITDHFDAKQFREFDAMISNPPYISSNDYARTTNRSVRDFEPKLALVPPSDRLSNQGPSQRPSRQGLYKQPSNLAKGDNGDLFYPDLLYQAQRLKVKVALLEVADMAQAIRVAKMATEQDQWKGIEIWRDDPAYRRKREGSGSVLPLGRGLGEISASTTSMMFRRQKIPIIGAGDGRSVLLYKGDGASWLGRGVGAGEDVGEDGLEGEGDGKEDGKADAMARWKFGRKGKKRWEK